MQAKSSEVNSPQQANSLASRLRWVCEHFRLQQKQLATVMGVDVDRVKSLVLGRAKTLRREEVERLVVGLGLMEAWLVDGRGKELTGGDLVVMSATAGTGGFLVQALKAIERAKEESGFGALSEPAPLAEAKSPPQSDAQLLVECVRATEAELKARGRQLDRMKRLRLYWAVFELSLQMGSVNRAAIGPLLDLATA